MNDWCHKRYTKIAVGCFLKPHRYPNIRWAKSTHASVVQPSERFGGDYTETPSELTTENVIVIRLITGVWLDPPIRYPPLSLDRSIHDIIWVLDPSIKAVDFQVCMKCCMNPVRTWTNALLSSSSSM